VTPPPLVGQSWPGAYPPRRCLFQLVGAVMESPEDKFGWEEVPRGSGSMNTAQDMPSSQLGGGAFGEVPGVGDAVTGAMMNHFAREFSKGSMSYLPQIMSTARGYFNVTHGYVLRKCIWQLAPVASTKKKSVDGELGAQKDWTVRLVDGLEVDIEEPDMYIPLMGFSTYVLLCGIVRGLQDTFNPDVISTAITFAMVAMILETALAKAVLFTAGAINTPTLDLVALLGYKFFYLSLHIMFGLILGWGGRPAGWLFNIFASFLVAACGIAMWQALRRLAKMQPALGQECMSEMHKVVLQALAAGQGLVYYCLLPSWPAVKVVALAAVAEVAKGRPDAGAVGQALVANVSQALSSGAP